MESLSVIMPFHNEESTLARVIPRVLSVELPIPMELILVDDGSTDESARLAEGFVNDPRVTYLRLPERSGKGAAVCRGLGASRGTILLIQDADLEYDPQEYLGPLSLILRRECDFALGSRVLGAGSWTRVHKIRGKPLYCAVLNAGSWGLTLMFRALYKIRVTDPNSMMKVFRRECVNGIDFESRGFDWDWELLCKLIVRGHFPRETPISYKARGPAEGKKLRLWSDGKAALIALVRSRLCRTPTRETAVRINFDVFKLIVSFFL